MRVIALLLGVLAGCTSSPPMAGGSGGDRSAVGQVQSVAPVVAVAPGASPIASAGAIGSPAASSRLITEAEPARRLARAIASDILLYNGDDAAKARATGVVPDSLSREIEEGRGLFRSRVAPQHEPLYQTAIDEIVLQKPHR